MDWIDVLSALLVPTIAILGVFIAYQQYRINRQRLRHDTYERRLAVFKIIKSYLSDVVRNAKADNVAARCFYSDASEAAFLFDKSVEEKIEEIYKKSIDMAYLIERMNPSDGSQGVERGEERNSLAAEHSELLKWHAAQLTGLRDFFSKKMGVNVT